jgi:hypothetical protein
MNATSGHRMPYFRIVANSVDPPSIRKAFDFDRPHSRLPFTRVIAVSAPHAPSKVRGSRSAGASAFSRRHAQFRLARQLLRFDRKLLADYLRFYMVGRLGSRDELRHRPMPGALGFDAGRDTLTAMVGRCSDGDAVALARGAPAGPMRPTSVGELDAQRLAGDESLGELLYYLIRATRPDSVIETGVAAGVTSAFSLAGLEDNGHGILHSVDLPPSEVVISGLVGSRIPDSLRHRWRYHWGSARRLLPEVLARTSGRRIFVHDSDHSYRNMRWELEQAWAALGDGDWLVADDVDLHDAFMDVAARHGAEPLFIAQRGKESCTGLMRRRSEPSEA